MTDDSARLLIADPSQLVADLIRGICKEIGFDWIEIVRTLSGARKALSILRPDLVIINTLMGEGNDLAMSFVSEIRDPRGSDCPMVPIIGLCAAPTQAAVISARDAGINEFLAVPFTVKALFDRVWAVVEKPRPFVLTEDFFGPDRRRSDKGPPETGERRSASKSPRV